MPFGYWYRLHWNFLTESLSRPLTFSNSYAPRSQIGAQYFGQIFIENTSLIYYTWLSDGTDQFGTNDRETESLAFGGSLFVEHAMNSDQDKIIGATIGYHQQAVANGWNSDGSVRELFQSNTVFGMKFNYKILEVRSEFYNHDRGENNNLYSWYATTNVELLEGFSATTRFEKGEDQVTNSFSELMTVPSQHKSFGLVWRPRAVVLIKCEYRINDYRDNSSNEITEDFNEWNIFFALKF